MEPTKTQIDYAQWLCDQLGYDPDDYRLNSLSRAELSELITELRSELGD